MLHWNNQRHTAVDSGALALVATGATNVGAVSVHVATAGFLQLFDAAAAANVTLGTTLPTLSFYIPVNNETPFQLGDRVFYFPRGLVYAITTTRTGSTLRAGTSTFWYNRE